MEHPSVSPINRGDQGHVTGSYSAKLHMLECNDKEGAIVLDFSSPGGAGGDIIVQPGVLPLHVSDVCSFSVI